jgi:hypothetical protein
MLYTLNGLNGRLAITIGAMIHNTAYFFLGRILQPSHA